MKVVLPALLVVTMIAAADAKPPPSVVTQAWMRDQHARGWPLDQLVDEQRGLIVLERRIDAPDEGFEGVVSAKKSCGAALERALPALRARLRSEYKTADTFHCHNKPSAGCSFTFASSYTTVVELAFEKVRDGTLRLSLVTFLDGGGQTRAFKVQQARWVARQVDKLSGVSCAGS